MKRRVQVVPPGGSIVGLDGQRWSGRMLITARCGHQFTTDSRPCIDLCMSTARLLDHHEQWCLLAAPTTMSAFDTGHPRRAFSVAK